MAGRQAKTAAALTVPRAYSYLRFSTPEQAKGDSLRRQTVLADEYAKRCGLALDTELNLRDLGVSAYRGDNAALGALGAFRRAVTDGLVPPGSFLLVENLDRISRQIARKAVRILEEIVEAGITLVTLNDGKQWTEESLNGADFLLAILLFMRGNEESATKAKRLKAAWVGKRERAARGEIQTAMVPAWIRVEGSTAKDQHNAKLFLIPERAALVRRMFDMFLAGTGKRGIALAFNAERIPTWGGARKPAVHWHWSYVYKILTNPAVTGRFTPHTENHEGGKLRHDPQPPIVGYYPAVIDELTFARVQRLIKARRGTVRSGHIASAVAGLARCPKCGSTMTRVMKGDPKKCGLPKLVCTKAKYGKGCDYASVPLHEVHAALIGAAGSLSNPPLVDTNLAEQIKGVDAELFHVSESIDSLVSSIERAPSAALSKRLAAREAEADAVREELKRLKALAADSESSVVQLRAKRLAEALTKFAGDQDSAELLAAVNSALRECVDAVVIDYTTSELRLQWRHGVQSALFYGAGPFHKGRAAGAKE